MMDNTSEYHWIITLRWHTASGDTATQTGEGVIAAMPGANRQSLYYGIIEYAAKTMGAPCDRSINVLFFSLEPNDVIGTEHTEQLSDHSQEEN